MENNFIQMAGHAIAYTIGSIFKHIIDCVQPETGPYRAVISLDTTA